MVSYGLEEEFTFFWSNTWVQDVTNHVNVCQFKIFFTLKQQKSIGYYNVVTKKTEYSECSQIHNDWNHASEIRLSPSRYTCVYSDENINIKLCWIRKPSKQASKQANNNNNNNKKN